MTFLGLQIILLQYPEFSKFIHGQTPTHLVSLKRPEYHPQDFKL